MAAYRPKEWGGRHLVVWRSAGVTVSFIQMVENFLNDFVLGNKSYHAEVTSAVAKERVGFEVPFDQISPSFSESGALLGRELGFVC